MILSWSSETPSGPASGRAGQAGKGAKMDEEHQSSRFFKISIVFLIMTAIHFRVSYTPADADLWGHVRFGQDIKETRRIITSDPYSYLTEGQPWINHEWLAEAVFAQLYDALGTPGLVLLKTVIDLTIIISLYVMLVKHGLDPLRAGIVIVIIAFLLFYHILTVRPQLFTYLLFLPTLLILEKAEEGRGRWLLVLPPMFALWVNLHGGFLAGVGVLLAWSTIHLILHLLKRSALTSSSPRMVLPVLIATCLALLLNPYGVRLLGFLLRTATVPRPEIVEWRSVAEAKYHFLAYLTLVSASLFSLHCSGRVKKPAMIIVYLLTAILPLMAIRHLPLFAIATVVITGEYIADLWNRLPGDQTKGVKSLERGMAAFSMVGGVGFLIFSVSNYACIPIVPRLVGAFPARAVAVLKQSGAEGNVACHYNWGEYLIWHLGPRIKVSMDGRRETVYSEAGYDESSRFEQGVGDWDELIRRPATDMVLVAKGTPSFNLVRLEPGWFPSYEDSLCSLFLRRVSPLRQQIEQASPPDLPPDGNDLCFP
jgi:hypothetical protein